MAKPIQRGISSRVSRELDLLDQGTAKELSNGQRRAEKIANVPNELFQSEHSRWLDIGAASETSAAVRRWSPSIHAPGPRTPSGKSLASCNVIKLRAVLATILGMMRELETEANC